MALFNDNHEDQWAEEAEKHSLDSLRAHLQSEGYNEVGHGTVQGDVVIQLMSMLTDGQRYVIEMTRDGKDYSVAPHYQGISLGKGKRATSPFFGWKFNMNP